MKKVLTKVGKVFLAYSIACVGLVIMSLYKYLEEWQTVGVAITGCVVFVVGVLAVIQSVSSILKVLEAGSTRTLN